MVKSNLSIKKKSKPVKNTKQNKSKHIYIYISRCNGTTKNDNLGDSTYHN